MKSTKKESYQLAFKKIHYEQHSIIFSHQTEKLEQKLRECVQVSSEAPYHGSEAQKLLNLYFHEELDELIN